MCIIGIGVFAETETMRAPIFPNTFTAGILEGYQTFDAIGGIVVGGVIVISLGLQKKYNYAQKKQMIAHAGLLSGLGLFLIYGGLIAVGAFNSAALSIDNRTQLLIALSKNTLGSIGTTFLGVLVALACFTTAVGIITGTADFIKKIAGNSQTAFVVTVIVGCALGVAVGQFDVQYIIAIALPVLTLIYPITIVLIVLNCIPNKYATALVFRAVTIATLLFTLPDFLGFVLGGTTVGPLKNAIPLANEGLGWVLPAVVVFVVANLFFAKPEKSRPVA
ncbi:MAG: branched-chain amino acid transport system II carrier protein, partial [Marinirhabdus sp.]